MKRYLLLLALLAAPTFAAEPRSIQVAGEGTVKAEPDQVKLNFGIESTDRSLVKAKDDNAQKTKQFLGALKKFDIPAKDIQTGYIQISPRYDYNNGKQVFNGYVAMKSLSVTLRELNEYGKILNAVIEAGVDHVNGLQFEHSKQDELMMEARKRAIANAKSKAEILAAELKQKVGQPLEIIEGGMTPPAMPMYRMQAMSMKESAVNDVLSPGENSITTSVTVRFELQ